MSDLLPPDVFSCSRVGTLFSDTPPDRNSHAVQLHDAGTLSFDLITREASRATDIDEFASAVQVALAQSGGSNGSNDSNGSRSNALLVDSAARAVCRTVPLPQASFNSMSYQLSPDKPEGAALRVAFRSSAAAAEAAGGPDDDLSRGSSQGGGGPSSEPGPLLWETLVLERLDEVMVRSWRRRVAVWRS